MPLYKPTAQGSVGHGQAVIVNPTGNTITVKAPDGTLIYQGKATHGTEGSKYTIGDPANIPPGSTYSIDGGPAYTISDPTKKLMYDPTKGGAPTSSSAVTSTGANPAGGPLPAFSNPTSGPGVPNGLGGSLIGDYGVAPAYIGNKFPKPDLITSAPYNYVNPITFGAAFDKTQNRLLANNTKSAGDFAQNAIGNELKALQSYVPASAALQRSTVGADNPFNQAQRSAQVASTLPGVQANLNQQTKDAATYASGQAPNSVIDNALTTSDRSNAADIASQSGFGVNSSAARGISDLMSAKDRIGLSQYGNSLEQSNSTAQQQLQLAPTEYANAGSQVKIMPALSASQLQQQDFNEINSFSLINPNTALGSATSQNQFVTSQQQATNVFNANNTNNFALSFFNYLNSYVNSVANAAQTNINTGVGVTQQANAAAAAVTAQDKAIQSQLIGAGGKAGGDIISSFFNWLNGGGGTTPGQPTQTGPTTTSPDVPPNSSPVGPGDVPNSSPTSPGDFGSTSDGTDQASYARMLTSIQQSEEINQSVG